MSNASIINITKRPYGYTGTVIIVDDNNVEYRSECLFGHNAPTTLFIESLCAKKLEIFMAETAQSLLVQSNENLASLAIAAKAILDKSDKIPAEAFSVLNYLVDGVKNIANSNPDDGTAATNLVNQMLATPELQADKELWKQINTMKEQIIQLTGGVL